MHNGNVTLWRTYQTGMHVRTMSCIHMEITSGLRAVQYSWSAQHSCPTVLCWRRRHLGGAAELDPEAAPENLRGLVPVLCRGLQMCCVNRVVLVPVLGGGLRLYCVNRACLVPVLGGGLQMCCANRAYVPAVTALPYLHTAGMHTFMHTSLRTAVFVLYPAPHPPRRCSCARGRSQTLRPRRRTRTLEALGQNQPKLGGVHLLRSGCRR